MMISADKLDLSHYTVDYCEFFTASASKGVKRERFQNHVMI